GVASDAGHDQSYRVGPLGDAPGHSARDALAGRGDAAAVVRGGPPARREQVPPGQGASGPPDADQGPGGIRPSATVWNRARRRVGWAGGTTSPHDDGWDRGGSRPARASASRSPRATSWSARLLALSRVQAWKAATRAPWSTSPF